MQLVMAAMTTDPCVTAAAASGCSRLSGGDSRTWPAGLPPSPTSLEMTLLSTGCSAPSNAASKDCRTPRSATRSCGRLGPARLGSTFDRSRSSTSLKRGSGSCVCPEQALFARVTLHRSTMAPRPVSCRYFNVFASTGKSVEVAPNSGDMFDERGAVGDAEGAEARPEELHELADDAVRLSASGSASGRGRWPSCRPAASPRVLTPSTIGFGRNIGWPSIAASASMPPTPHPSTPEAVDHRRVRVGPDQGVGKDPSVREATTRPRCSRLT